MLQQRIGEGDAGLRSIGEEQFPLALPVDELRWSPLGSHQKKLGPASDQDQTGVSSSEVGPLAECRESAAARISSRHSKLLPTTICS